MGFRKAREKRREEEEVSRKKVVIVFRGIFKRGSFYIDTMGVFGPVDVGLADGSSEVWSIISRI